MSGRLSARWGLPEACFRSGGKPLKCHWIGRIRDETRFACCGLLHQLAFGSATLRPILTIDVKTVRDCGAFRALRAQQACVGWMD